MTNQNACDLTVGRTVAFCRLPGDPVFGSTILALERGNRSQTAYGIYDLPLGKGRQYGSSMPKWADAVVGGWQTTWNMDAAKSTAFLTKCIRLMIPPDHFSGPLWDYAST